MLKATIHGAAGALLLTAAAAAQDSPRVLLQQQESQKISADLIGMAVFNPQGETVGKISQLVIEPDQKVSAVVLSVGGFLGIGAKPVAVPLQSVQFDNTGGKDLAVVNLTREELSNAPEFKTLERQKEERSAAQIQREQENRQPSRTPQ